MKDSNSNFTGLNQNLNIYLKEIRTSKSLTPESEKELFERVAQGDEKAIKEIFMSVSKFAVAVAKLYTGNPETLEDLIQEANMGVLEAIPTFDISQGNRFISYAVWTMKMKISDFIGDSAMVKNNSRKKFSAKVNKIRKDFVNKNHRNPTDIEVMDALEAMGEVVKDVKYLSKICMTSIDQTVGEDGDTFAEVGEFADITAHQNGFIKVMEDEFKKVLVSHKMSVLTDREKTFIKMKFGLDGLVPMEYADIAEWATNHYGKHITGERVRQIVVSSIEKMK